MNVLVTGGGGYIGSQVVAALAADGIDVTSLDLREPTSDQKIDGANHVAMDIRSPELADLCRENHITNIVHLAAIVTPAGKANRELEYQIDVVGTHNVLEAAKEAGVAQVVISSSGAAYGYHADNPTWLSEGDSLRGNEAFAYSDHKRLVEEMLAEWREHTPQIKQLILRPGTVLGENTHNQITDLFDRSTLFGPGSKPIPFVFIWDQDVVRIILQGLTTGVGGEFNLAGDGAVPLKELAERMGKRFVSIPAWLVKGALSILHPLGLSQYGPAQVDFLRYRPVLSNRKLKEEFSYTPQLTSSETFDLFWAARGN